MSSHERHGFIQRCVQTDINGGTAISHYWHFVKEEPSITGGFPSQRASNTESILRHDVIIRIRGRLDIKISSYQYRNLHVKDKTVSRPSYL